MDQTESPIDTVTISNEPKSSLLISAQKFHFVNILVIIFLVVFSTGTINELSDSYPYFYPQLLIAPNSSVFQTLPRPVNSCIPYIHPNISSTKPPSTTQSTISKPLSPVVWISIINLASYLPALLLSIIYSVWSDMYQNRKIFLLLCIAGFLFQGIGALATIASITTPVGFIPGNVISGIFGGYPTFLFSCYAYTVDIGEKASLTTRFVIIQFVLFVAQAITTSTSERWAKAYGLMPPLILAVVLLTVALVYTWVLLRAPLVTTTRSYMVKRAKDHIADLLHNFPRFFKTVFKPRKDTPSHYYYILLVIFFFAMFPTTGFGEIINIYLAGYPICWNIDEILMYDSFRAASFAIGGIIVWFTLRYHISELTLSGIGMTFFTIQIGILTIAKESSIVYLSIAIGALGGITFPCIYGQLSNEVSDENQGVLFCFIALLEVIIAVAAFPIYYAIYMGTRYYNASGVFVGVAVLYLIPKSIIWIRKIRNCKCCRRGEASEV